MRIEIGIETRVYKGASPKKVNLPPRRSCGNSGGGTRPHRQGLLRHPSVVLPPPEFDAGSPARDEDGRRQGSARILWETRAAGRLPPSPRRCPPHLFVVPLGGLSRGAWTVAQASMVSAARARLPMVGIRWLPARLPMVGAWRAAAAAWLPVGYPAARRLALSAWPPVVTPLRQLHLRLWCWKG